jgi:hypothetical protein
VSPYEQTVGVGTLTVSLFFLAAAAQGHDGAALGGVGRSPWRGSDHDSAAWARPSDAGALAAWPLAARAEAAQAREPRLPGARGRGLHGPSVVGGCGPPAAFGRGPPGTRGRGWRGPQASHGRGPDGWLSHPVPGVEPSA